uniref:High light inducible protein n=1 Tax=Cryptomonas curvata TaxID=233186 RepID=A0A222AH74_9CRYP|nr:high light inducible protein [Cryptomonas curvata]ASO75719.1 high light inducible protein [Cryptomonas curvata]
MEKDTVFLPWVWGFTTSAENWNGRLAMLGFLITILIELVTGKGVIHFIGLI